LRGCCLIDFRPEMRSPGYYFGWGPHPRRLRAAPAPTAVGTRPRGEGEGANRQVRGLRSGWRAEADPTPTRKRVPRRRRPSPDEERVWVPGERVVGSKGGCDVAEGFVEVVRAEYRDVRGWLDLAAEVEPLFGSMLDDPEFYRVLLVNIERGSAYCVRAGDGSPETRLLGGMLFSPPRETRPTYRIGWLAVAEGTRQRGIGGRLVELACGLVVPPATLEVVTFGEENELGRPARRLYERWGFAPMEAAPDGSEGASRQVFRRSFA
jgi:ribosomal protein S18 acetylase RimI-like enzyme